MADAARIENLTDTLRSPSELRYVPEFRVATYNVHNLFGEKPDVHSSRPDPPASDEQLAALGEVIREIDADVIAFEEVQNEKVLANLFRQHVNPALRRRKEDTFDAFVCVPARDPRGINVALATRLAVRGTVTFHDYEFAESNGKTTRFSRDLLGVEVFVTPKYSFLCFVAHLKSKLGGDRSERKREIEATEIRELFEQPVFGGAPYIGQDLILAGDMNTDPDTQVVTILRNEQRSGEQLVDLLGDLDPNYTYPTHTRYKKTRLDYLFASPSIAPRVKPAERRIHRDDPAAVASDHYAASITIDVPA
jgi:endonuclease/exonuclease/phosphatase family metal-dependent hydrolase